MAKGAYRSCFVKRLPFATLVPVAVIYLDHNATTPLDPAVLAAMEPFLAGQYGNPSSIHSFGRAARAAVDAAREDVASLLGCRPSEVTFTSGGTESCNLAVLGIARGRCSTHRHLVVSAVEHPAVLGPARYLAAQEGFELSVVPVDSDGRIKVNELASVLRPDTTLVSVMAANNEVGVVQPFAEVAELCCQAGVLFHCDASQWLGKLPLPALRLFGAQLVSLCGHKFGGPKGCGLLVTESGCPMVPLAFGGAQEAERRPGTENVAAIVGFATACRLFAGFPMSPDPSLTPLARSFRQRLAKMPGVSVWSGDLGCLPNTVAVSVAGADSLTLLAALDLAGVSASSGSACSVGSLEPSHVLLAMGASPAEAGSFVRFSVGRQTTAADADAAAAVFEAVINQVSRV